MDLTYSEGLELENMNLDTTFRNLSRLDLSLNEWSSKVSALILKKAGNHVTSITLGGNNEINDDTLFVLKNYCLKLNSLSISSISVKSLNT